MKNIYKLSLFLVLLIGLNLNAYAQSFYTSNWENTITGNSADIITNVITTSDGGSMLIGYSQSDAGYDKSQSNSSEVRYGTRTRCSTSWWGRRNCWTETYSYIQEYYDYWVVKLDANGNKVWDRTYQTMGHDYPYDVIETANGDFIIGGNSGSQAGYAKSQSSFGGNDYWVIRISPNGTKIWDKTFGGNNTEDLRSITATPDGNYMLGGFSYSNPSGNKMATSKGNADYWLVKIDDNGNKIWDKSYGGNNNDVLRDLITTADGFTLAGYSASEVGFDKTALFYGGYDYWVVNIDFDGNLVWDQSFGGSGADLATSIAKTSSNEYVINGYSNSAISGNKSTTHMGGYDAWVVKIDSNGELIWENIYGDNTQNIGHDVSVTPGGLIVASGYSQSPNGYGSNDYWTFIIDDSGELLEENFQGGTGSDILVAQSLEGNSYTLAGYSSSAASGTKSESSLSYDYWVVNYTMQFGDVTPPIISLENTLFTAEENTCSAQIADYGVIATDDMGGSVTITYNTGFELPAVLAVGTHELEVTASDAFGNSATETFTLTVSDVTAPVVSVNNISIELDAAGSATITAEQINNGSTDACGIASIALDNTAFGCENVGANTVILTVTDNNGNVSTGEATVTVNDVTAPVVSVNNISIDLDATGSATITAEQIDNGSTDACGIASIALDNTAFGCENVGANTVTLTVTDENENVSTKTATVTVSDVTAPVVSINNISIDLDATGSATITAEQIDNGSTDACGIASIALDNTAFGCENVGVNTVTLTVTDENDNVSTKTATVTVSDVTAPVVSVNNISIDLDATGSATITAEQIDNGSTDACGIASISLDNTVFGCENVGANTVTLTVTDNNGNVSTGEATVTVNDVTGPVVSVNNISIDLDAAGSATITAEQIDNGSTDACGIASIALDNTVFGCENVGVNTVTLTVTDENNNVSTKIATVTVSDVTAPVVSINNISIDLDATGSATITAEQIDNGSTDACGIASIALDNTAFGCENVGVNTVTLTVTDENDNVSTKTATVTVSDVTAPVVSVNNISIDLDAAGLATITAEQIDNGSTDACGIASISLDNTVFGCENVGANTVTLTVTDNNGNVSTGEATVTVNDVTGPVVSVNNISIDLDATGSAIITAEQINNGSTDACGIASISLDNTVFGCENVGVNTVTLTVTDENDNVSTKTATVTVSDVTAPVVSVNNISIDLDAAGLATITAEQIDNGSTDACGIASISLDNTVFGCENVGANTVTLTVTDNNGNVSTGEATVTVNDVTAPVVSVNNISIDLDAAGSATITAEQIDNGSTDACGIASISLDKTVFGCENVGVNTVTLTVTDENDNVSTKTATVTVNDVTAPVVSVNNISIDLDATGSATITAEQIDNGSTDACGIASISLDNTVFGCENVGVNTVTLTVTDENDNVSTKTATVTVSDVTAPAVSVNNISVDLDAAGSATITAEQIDNGSTDACGIASIALDNTAFGCENVGPNTVTLTVTDNNGNVSAKTATVTVNDVTAPAVSVNNISIDLDAAGSATITAEQIDNGSTDACGIASLALDNTAFGCENVGINTVTLTVTDNNGNVSTKTATVTVNDVTAPVVSVNNISIELDAAGSATITAEQIDNGSTDACGIASIALDNTAFGCENVGVNTVTLTVTDNNGNVSTGEATVTVNDVIAPVIEEPSDITVLNDPGICGAIVELMIPEATDNCSVVSIDNNAPDVFELGTTEVTWIAIDPSGNSTTVTQEVTVYNEAPVINSATLDFGPTLIGDVTNGSVNFVDNNLSEATWYWGDGTSNSGWVGETTVEGENYYSAPGVYPVSVILTDMCDEETTNRFYEYVAVYDPDAGYVTGGGWFNTEPGTLSSEPSYSGKTHVSFVTRYKKGLTKPMGSLNFRSGDLELKTKDFEYMALRNHMAIIKGSGSLNDGKNVEFILSVVDGEILGFGSDLIRVKIWDENGEVLFDNELGQPLNKEATYELTSGSIVIHLERAYDNTDGICQVFPNPFTDVIQLNVTVPQVEDMDILIFDMKGEIVKRETRSLISGENGLRLDLLSIDANPEDIFIMRCSSMSIGAVYVKLVRD